MDAVQPGRRIVVALEIEDAALRQSLAAAVLLRPDLRLAGGGEAAMVVLTDRRHSAPEHRGEVPAVLLDDVHGNRLAPGFAAMLSREEDPHVVLSAAQLIAADFTLGRKSGVGGNGAGFGAVDGDHALDDKVRLSPRETEVLDLLVDGCSNKLVARRLGISVHTAKFHVAAVIDKLGASNRSDAVATAFRDGYVSL